MSVNKSLIGIQVSILGLAVAILFGEIGPGYLLSIFMLLYGSYLVGNNEYDR